jgi:hypothetical protein
MGFDPSVVMQVRRVHMQHLLASAGHLLHYLTALRSQIDSGRKVRVETEFYTLEGRAAIDRVSVDLKAGRITRFKLFDSEIGDRDVEVNYLGR